MVRWLRWHCPPDTGFEIQALAVWGRARYSRSQRLPTILTFTRGCGKNIFSFFRTAETGNRTPDSGVKGSGANHYPRAPAPETKKRLQVGYKCHHVTAHSHELMSLVSINCVNNIECYWNRSHSLIATHCLPWVLSDLFLGQCHQLPLLLPLGLHMNHLKPLSATVVALIRFISHLNIKICKLLSLKLQIKQIRVFSLT